ncbi:MAG: TolC family protein [Crocinitomicaceae bacterium]|nr:TolC family protein [Crocinitomicaceae bacterium]
MFRILSAIILLIFAFTPLKAQQAFSLFEAQTHALENAEKIKKAQVEYQIARKKVIETRAIGLPQISGDIGLQNFLAIPVQVVDGAFIGQPGEFVSFRAGTEYMANTGLSVNQLLFDGSYIVALQVSRFYQKFVADNIEKSKQEVLFDVTQAYELALVSRENKVFLDSLVVSSQELLAKQQHFFDLGLIPEEDLDQIKYALLQAKTNLSSANYAYDNAIALLKMMMAFPMEQDISLSESLNDLVKSSSVSTSLEGSIYENIDLQLLNKQKQLNEYDLKNKKMANLPKLNASFGHMYNFFSDELRDVTNRDNWFDQTFIGLSLNIPIFSSGMRWAQVQQAKLVLEQDQYNIQELERGLKMQEIQYRNDFQNAKAQIILQKENVSLAQKIYQNALNKAEIGKENSLVVTQKYQQLVSAQTQYVNAMLDIFNAKRNLDILYNKLNK